MPVPGMLSILLARLLLPGLSPHAFANASNKASLIPTLFLLGYFGPDGCFLMSVLPSIIHRFSIASQYAQFLLLCVAAIFMTSVIHLVGQVGSSIHKPIASAIPGVITPISD